MGTPRLTRGVEQVLDLANHASVGATARLQRTCEWGLNFAFGAREIAPVVADQAAGAAASGASNWYVIEAAHTSSVLTLSWITEGAKTSASPGESPRKKRCGTLSHAADLVRLSSSSSGDSSPLEVKLMPWPALTFTHR